MVKPDGTTCSLGNSSCEPTSWFGNEDLGIATGIGVRNDGKVFVTDEAFKSVMVFEPVITPDTLNVESFNVDIDSAEVGGDVGLAKGADVTDCYWEWGRSDAYEKAPIPCDPEATEGSPFTTETHVEGEFTELAPNTLYHFRLVAANENGEHRSEDHTFTTPGPPGIEAFGISGLTANSVDFNAKINPNGPETTYYFKFGRTTTYGSVVPVVPGSIEAGFEPQDVTTHVEIEDTSYHFQVFAENKYGSAVSEDQAFSFHPETCPNQTVRQQTGAAYLPDCRAYELVTSSDTGSAFIFSGGPQKPYADPPRVSFTADYGDIPEAGGNPINTTGDLYVASRTGGGWKTKFVGVPGSVSGCAGGRPVHGGAGLASTVQNDVKADRNLTRVVDWQLGNPTQCVWDTIGGSLRVVDHNEKTFASMSPWVWDTSDGSFVGRLPTSVADVEGSADDFDCKPQPVGASGDTNCSNNVELSGDLSHFVFSTKKDIYNGGPDALSAAPGSAYDNDTVNNTLSLISVLPGGGPIEQESSPNGGANEVIQFPEVSEDGSHILMGTLKNPQCRQVEYPSQYYNRQCPAISDPSHLYMRVNDAVTYEVAPVPVSYYDSSPDARKVYFTTAQALVAEDEDTNVDLYMWSDLGGGAEPDAGLAGIRRRQRQQLRSHLDLGLRHRDLQGHPDLELGLEQRRSLAELVQPAPVGLQFRAGQHRRQGLHRQCGRRRKRRHRLLLARGPRRHRPAEGRQRLPLPGRDHAARGDARRRPLLHRRRFVGRHRRDSRRPLQRRPAGAPADHCRRSLPGLRHHLEADLLRQPGLRDDVSLRRRHGADRLHLLQA